MKKPSRNDIHIITKHSDLKKEEVNTLLTRYVYHDKHAWQKFVKRFLISLGVGFTVSGVVFFFAYNWDAIPKLAKLGLIEFLLLAVTFPILFSKFSTLTKNGLLTAATILVGVLLAVFGQIYQTGADTYDLFLSWMLMVSLWVWISRFPPLWLFYILLINIVVILYSQQIARNWSFLFACALLCGINLIILVFLQILNKNKLPVWFARTLELIVMGYITIGTISGIEGGHHMLYPFLLTGLGIYTLALWYGFKERNGFYFWTIPMSLILIISTFIIDISSAEITLLFVSTFIMLSVTGVILYNVHLQKMWNHEKS